MTTDTFREIIRRRPFDPFRVVMSGGESYVIADPDTLLATKRALVLCVRDLGKADGERLVFCSYSEIARVEILRPVSTA